MATSNRPEDVSRYHSEKDGKDFENYMGKAEFQELVGKKYEDFLHDAFSACYWKLENFPTYLPYVSS